MSEISESTSPVEPTSPPVSFRRILIITAATAIIGSIAGYIFVAPLFGAGVLFGGALCAINYYWLNSSLKNLFAAVTAGGSPGFTAARYIGRYLTLGAILIVVFLTQIVSFVAVIAGLLSFAAAIVIEGLIRLFLAIYKKKEL